MKRVTMVIEVPDEMPIEQAVKLGSDGPRRRLIYGYEGDTVADLRHVIANSGTPERLEAAVDRVRLTWYRRL